MSDRVECPGCGTEYKNITLHWGQSDCDCPAFNDHQENLLLAWSLGQNPYIKTDSGLRMKLSDIPENIVDTISDVLGIHANNPVKQKNGFYSIEMRSTDKLLWYYDRFLDNVKDFQLNALNNPEKIGAYLLIASGYAVLNQESKIITKFGVNINKEYLNYVDELIEFFSIFGNINKVVKEDNDRFQLEFTNPKKFIDHANIDMDIFLNGPYEMPDNFKSEDFSLQDDESPTDEEETDPTEDLEGSNESHAMESVNEFRDMLIAFSYQLRDLRFKVEGSSNFSSMEELEERVDMLENRIDYLELQSTNHINTP